MLKPLETGYDHVYFIFCTNQPEKLRSKKKDAGEAFLGRCSILNFNRVGIEEIRALLQNICEFEGFNYNKDVLDLIAEESKGVPRDATIWLNQISLEGSWSLSTAKEICSVISEIEEPLILDLCKALTKGSWKDSTEIFEKIKTVPIETIRIAVVGWFVNCLRRSKKFGDGKKFSIILDIITTPIYEQGKLAEYRWYNYMFKIVDTIMAYGRSK